MQAVTAARQSDSLRQRTRSLYSTPAADSSLLHKAVSYWLFVGLVTLTQCTTLTVCILFVIIHLNGIISSTSSPTCWLAPCCCCCCRPCAAMLAAVAAACLQALCSRSGPSRVGPTGCCTCRLLLVGLLRGPGSTVQLALAVLQAECLGQHRSCCDVVMPAHVLGMVLLRGTC